MLGKLSQRLGVLMVNDPILLTFLLGHGLEVCVTANISAVLEVAKSGLKVSAAFHLYEHPRCATVCFLLSGQSRHHS